MASLVVGLIILPLILVAGLRNGVGTDFYNYIGIYNVIANKSFLEVISAKEVGFNLITWICAQIKYNPQIMFFLMSLITISFSIRAIKKYSTKVELSLFLYITTMIYFTPFNIVRQGVAVAILFYALKYIYTNEKVKYFVIILIAISFHSSAVIMFPIYFLVRYPFKSRVIKTLGLVGVIGYFAFDKVWIGIMKLLQILGFEKYVDLYAEITNGGVHILRVLVAATPVLLSCLFYKQLKIKYNRIDILINFSVINLIILVMALNATYLARLNLYVEVYNILLIPCFIGILDKKSKPLGYIFIILLFFIFMVTQVKTQSNLLPYKTIFGI